MKQIDISKLSEGEFGIVVSLNTVYQREMDGGISYLNPVFRQVEGQHPLNIEKYTIKMTEKGVDWKDMKEFAERTYKHIAFVLRDNSGDLVGVLHLPEAKYERMPSIKCAPDRVVDAIAMFREKYRPD